MNYYSKISFILLFLSLSFQMESQSIRNNQFIKISYANDLFTGTDLYFTQGIRIEVAHQYFKKSPIAYFSLLSKNENSNQYSIALQQDGFTPSSIRYDSILHGDRPYCASMFLTNSQYSTIKNKKISTHAQLVFGVIGPMALGYEEQTAIHKTINDELPKGWKHQIQNDLILNYNLSVQKYFLTKKWIEIAYNVQGRIGTMFSDLSIGMQSKLGLHTDIFNAKKTTWQFYGFGNAQIKAVGYNATLQGGLLNRKSDYTIAQKDIQRLIPQLEVGISSGFKNIEIQFSHTYIGKEFSTGNNHAWGKLSLLVGF